MNVRNKKPYYVTRSSFLNSLKPLLVRVFMWGVTKCMVISGCVKRVFCQCLELRRGNWGVCGLFQNGTQNPSCFFPKRISFKKRFEAGVGLIEIMMVSFILAVVGLGSAYYVTQSKVTMKSSMQRGSCPELARETLEQFVTFGTRLYGYSYDGGLGHSKDTPRFRPLLLEKASGNSFTDVAGCGLGCGVSSKLRFPSMLNHAFRQLSVNLMSLSPTGDGKWVNTGRDIIRIEKTGTPPNEDKIIHLGSSVFLLNQVNVLQYFYNSNKAYFTDNGGMGKEFLMSSHPQLKEYAEEHSLQDLKLYFAINPVDLENDEVITSYGNIKCGEYSKKQTPNYKTVACPRDGTHRLILTRPRFSSDIKDNKIPDFVVVHGTPNLGFQLKVTLAYQYHDSKGDLQDLTCDAMQTFTHQMDTMKWDRAPSGIQMASSVANQFADLKSPHKDRKSDDDDDKNVLTSCGPDDPDGDGNDGSHGSSYNDITVEINFNVRTKERGTLLVCQGRNRCRSGDSLDSYSGNGISCTPEVGKWTRCHDVTFPGQTGTTNAEMTTANRLRLTFNDLPDNKRFDLYVAELSTAGTLSQQRRVSRFYIDTKRPKLINRQIPDKDVGIPEDGGTGGRNYTAHRSVSWSEPSGSLSGKWLQCNTDSVDFEADQEDQFTHNFKKCEREGSRRDGAGGPYTISLSDITVKDTSSIQFKTCKAVLNNIKHGRQTVSLFPKDSCEKGAKTDFIWDTDLPNTFQKQNTISGTKKYKWSQGPNYNIRTGVPASGAGTFPKHYAVDCAEEDNWWWPNAGGVGRKDGDGGALDCKRITQENDIDNGCNPNGIGADYWHVCGGASQPERGKWMVYASEEKVPIGSTCKNVDCEPGEICCDGYKGECGRVSKDLCSENRGYVNNGTKCTNPKAGANPCQDGAGCPPRGLYKCNYEAPCNAKTPFSKVKQNACPCGKRQGGSCSFPESGRCYLNGSTGWSSSCNDGGRCIIDGNNVGGCNTGCRSRRVNCRRECRSRTRCRGRGRNRVCTTDPCARRVRVCDTEYNPRSSGSCSRTFRGTCGQLKGGCGPKSNASRGSKTSELCPLRPPGLPVTCVPKNGVCNTSGSECTCSSGSASNCQESDTGWTWTCSGNSCGSSMACSKNKAIPGGCKNEVDKCQDHNTATRTGPDGDTTTHHVWDCTGINGGSTETCKLCNEDAGFYGTKAKCQTGMSGERECYQDGTTNGCWTRRLITTCPPDKPQPHWDWVPGKGCLPSCGHACTLSPAEGTCASGKECEEKTTYSIVPMGEAYDQPKCCKRKPLTKDKCGQGADCAVCGDTGTGNKASCCATGFFRPDTDTTEVCKWKCGETACEEPIIIEKENGKCATAPYTTRANACEKGIPQSFRTSNSGHTWTWHWICKGKGVGSTDDTCSHTCRNSVPFTDDCRPPANSTGCNRVGSGHPHKTAGCFSHECQNCYQWNLSSWSCNQNNSFPDSCSRYAGNYSPNLSCPDTCNGGSCTGTGEYPDEPTCQNGLNTSTEECYLSGTCWKRRPINSCDDSDCTNPPSGNIFAVHKTKDACNGAKDRCKDVCLNVCNGACFTQSRCGSSQPYRLATNRNNCTKHQHLGVCGGGGGGGGDPKPVCGTPSVNCADNGSGADCCDPGHYHNHPGDGTDKWEWTCRKTKNSSSGEIRCNGDKPICTGTGEYPNKPKCQDGFSGTCVKDGKCWKRPDARVKCTCSRGKYACGTGCSATDQNGPTLIRGKNNGGINVIDYETTWKCEGTGKALSDTCKHHSIKCHSYQHQDTQSCLSGDRKVDGVTYPANAEECTTDPPAYMSCNYLYCSRGFIGCTCKYAACRH